MRSDEDVERAVAAAVETFGGIDIVVNNASAVDIRKTPEIAMKRYDLMLDVNVRGTFLLSKTRHPAPARVGEPAHPDAVAAAATWTGTGRAGTSPTRSRSTA